MKERLAEELFALVDITKVGLSKAVEVLQAEAPELVREIINYHLILKSLGVFFGLSFLIIAILCFRYINKLGSSLDLNNNICHVFSLTGCIIGGAISTPIIITNLFYLLKILVAPRLFLIQYISDLIK